MKFTQPENSDSNLKQQELRVMAAKQIAKQFLPELHIKTHFKATQEGFNRGPSKAPHIF